MHQTIKEQSLAQYIEKLKEKLIFEFFNQHEYITGKEIKQFSESEQVNTFILHQLFAQWHQEMGKIESPYFDYENEDVKASLEQLMNSLSFNIKVSKEHFEPLVQYALDQTFKLVLQPLNYLKLRCFSFEELLINKSLVLKQTKFIKTNRFIFEDYLNNKSTDTVFSKDELLDACQSNYLNKKERTSFNDLIHLFSPLMPTDIINVFENKQAYNPEQTENSSLNDKLSQQEAGETVADKLARIAKRNNTLKSIPLNEKFTFINSLFDGDSAIYQKALHAISDMKNAEEAKTFLKDNFAYHYHWEENEEVVDRFYTLIENAL